MKKAKIYKAMGSMVLRFTDTDSQGNMIERETLYQKHGINGDWVKVPMNDISERPTVLGDLAACDCGL
jgi:hypothetical protein